MKHPYKLLVIDIDGTLVDKTGIISPEDKKALDRVHAAGIPLSLCTGRSILASKTVIRRLTLDGFHIFFDGALVASTDAEREIYARPLPKTAVKQIVE